MRAAQFMWIRSTLCSLGVLCLHASEAGAGESGRASGVVTNLVIEEVHGRVEISRVEDVWDPAVAGQILSPGQAIRTGRNARAKVLLLGGSAVASAIRLDAESSFRVPPAQGRTVFSMLRGRLYFFHRGRPGTFELRHGRVVAGFRGTELHLEARDETTLVLSVIDGEMVVRTNHDKKEVRSREELAVLASGELQWRPTFRVNDLIQWCLYYPPVVDPDELRLDATTAAILEPSLGAYRRGNVKSAAERYPLGRSPASAAERVYRAGLALVAGQVQEAETLLVGLTEPDAADTPEAHLVRAIEGLIAAVKLERQGDPTRPEPLTASEWLARSYQFQAEANLPEARAAARQAVDLNPGFGFGWSRLAELEFCFGRVAAARAALNRALKIVPEQPQAVALQGFLLAAANRPREAWLSFEQAISLDPSYADAWLGRGLCRIRLGDRIAGQHDLLTAASLEPLRSLPRSYLAKGMGISDATPLARKELNLAVGLDPLDPTPWLYRALLEHEENRIHEAVRDLEESIALNDNRARHRSKFLLDQDRAVRGANLAVLYRDAGLAEVGVQEAIKSAYADWSNYSAHQFLANSLNNLRDPGQISLRYETPWLTEYLTAQLLAPPGAGSLSPLVSQYEYARLFERDRLGLASETRYSSNGDWLQTAVQHGNVDGTAYALETTYRTQNGYRPNQDLDQLTLTFRAKQQVASRDSVYFQAIYYQHEAGDLAPYYDPAWANTELRVNQTQEPIVLAGYHREWNPGIHTLFLAGRLQSEHRVSNPQTQVLSRGQVSEFREEMGAFPFDVQYQNEQETYTAEMQQILQSERHTLVLGGRYQAGSFDTTFTLSDPEFGQHPGTHQPPLGSSLERITAYSYYHWRPIAPLLLVGGVCYDQLTYPINHRSVPISDAEDRTTSVGPKAGLIWNPFTSTTVRGGYARALGGVDIDQSFRLEPSQVTGFSQSFRSIIPESEFGSIPAEQYDMAGLSLEQKLPSRTYLAIAAGQLWSEIDRALGMEVWRSLLVPPTSDLVSQSLDYQERTLTATAHQLLPGNWSLGVRYELSQASLDTDFPDIPADVEFRAPLRREQNLDATLHQVSLLAVYNHPSGFFARGEAEWYRQSNRGYNPDRPGDEFWQFNLFAGYRVFRRHAEITLGLLNLSDQDYRLNPLNLTPELPRDRTFITTFRFFF